MGHQRTVVNPFMPKPSVKLCGFQENLMNFNTPVLNNLLTERVLQHPFTLKSSNRTRPPLTITKQAAKCTAFLILVGADIAAVAAFLDKC